MNILARLRRFLIPPREPVSSAEERRRAEERSREAAARLRVLRYEMNVLTRRMRDD